MLKSILQKILGSLARARIAKSTPVIIGVTGSVGKTSTKEAIAHVLRKRYSVRTAEKNYNTEIGLPITILGIPHYGRNIFLWSFALIRVYWDLFVSIRQEYPQVLVLEYGIDHPRDMDVLLSVAKPHIAVVTRIGKVPVHVEFFRDAEDLREEKAKLIRALPKDGYAILNVDDDMVFEMKKDTQETILTFGMDKHADFRISHPELHMATDEHFGEVPDGITFKVEHKGKSSSIKLPNGFGLPQVYSASAAIAVGFVMQMNSQEIADALLSFEPPPGRLRLLEGLKHSRIIDDTYNAAPDSARAALQLLEALPAKRKIAVLGDMREIGRYSEEAHRVIGRQAAGVVHMLLTVGPQARFIGEELKHLQKNKSSTFPRGIGPRGKNSEKVTSEAELQGIRKVLDKGTRDGGEAVFSFANSVTAGKMLQSILRPGDLILIKGSQAVRMEKIVLEIMARPEEAKKLLVRQETYWKRQ